MTESSSGDTVVVGPTADDVKRRAHELGFDLCGIAPADAYPELRHLQTWLDRGYAGEMRYMARSAERRGDVRRVLPSARSVVCVAVLYHVERPYSTERTRPGDADISRYAWGDDYHAVLGRRLEALQAWMRERAGRGSTDEAFEARSYVDTGPLVERAYAQRAGLGWVGKNTCLIHPSLGSWLFLGEIICNLPLTPDAPALDQCGSCTLCLEACPTGAFVEPRMLDATRCISYLTIELKGSIPEAQRAGVGTHAYGCDICQEVCPWNLSSPTSSDPAWLPRAGLDAPALAGLWRRSDEELGALLAGSAMSRAGVRGLRRNLAVAIGNSGDRAATAALDEPVDAPSIHDPMVAEHVAWARRRARTET